MKLNDLRIDAKKRQNGDWVPLGDLKGEIKVRGSGNDDWLIVQDKEAKRIRMRDKTTGPLTPKQQRELLIECILQAGLLDWRGDLFTGDDEKPIPYTPEKAAELYKDPSFELLVNITSQACDAMALADYTDEAEAAKN